MKPSKTMLMALAVMLMLSLSGKVFSGEKEPVDYVNPYMGNISHLLVPTYPTIHLPNSMLRVYPERNDYTGDRLGGLPLVITSHRGSSAFNLSPYQGDESGLKPVIDYSYDFEEVTPYSYSVYFDEQETFIDFGLSHQSAIYDVRFQKDAESYLIVNSTNGGLSWDGQSLTGHQIVSSEIGGNQTNIYLSMQPENLPESVYVLDDGELLGQTEVEGEDACLVLKYPEGTSNLKVRYGISLIDADQARQNLEREVAGSSIPQLHKEGRKIWNEALGNIDIKGGSDDEKTVFYTSLYRTYERPVKISEDGRYYSAFDGQVHDDNGTPFYTDDWIWDTYRATHPLRVIIEPELETDIINSFLRMAEQMDNFWLPTFPEITGDSRRMNSNHGVATIIDSYRKGLDGFDLERAYEASRRAITEKTLAPWSGAPAGELDEFYKEHGYIPALGPDEEEYIPEVQEHEKRQPVPVTLGTAYDEWCLAQIAQELGKEEDYERFLSDAYNYRNLFHPETHFFHPKDSAGEFIQPFDYRFSGGLGAREFYGENNGWVYRWDVPHNIADLVDLMGGPENFVANMDSMFAEPLGVGLKFQFYSQLPDHTGNVGQFSMANEPSLHIPYLYNYGRAPWKTQKRIRILLDQWFRNDLMGVPGDEDGGGMSAFVVFSQMGFYPVTPGLPMYNIGSPTFEEATVNLPNGETFKVIARNYAPENKYIQFAKLNGENWNKPWFRHQDIMEGGTLELFMGKYPNKEWGASPDDVPPSFSMD
ncbi:MAG: GH92 family glycosyl hydrolase [Bacteroidota bacterium]